MDKIHLKLDDENGNHGHDSTGAGWLLWSSITFQVTCVICGKQISSGWGRGQFGPDDSPVCIEHVETGEPPKLYIVTRAHNQDYISATAYLTKAYSEQDAIINCMRYEGDLDGFLDADVENDEDDPTLQAELTRLRSLSLAELEQDDRDNGNVWHAELFKPPTDLKPGDVVQIAELDTD